MPRRNVYLLLAVAVVGVACALQNDRFGRLLTYAMRQIDQRHLEEVKRKDLFEGAMDGMTRRLQEKYADEYSGYVSPEEAQPFNEELDHQFGGLGIHVTMSEETGEITVLSPLVGTPAYKAGVLAGDVIRAIDGRSTEGMTLEDAVKLIHGEPGTPVRLSVKHAGEEKPVEMTIVRAIIQVDTVLGDRRKVDGSWEYFLEGEDRIAYVRINTIADGTDEQLGAALEWLVAHDMRGLILDLRFNSGGYLREAVAICDMFVESGSIVSTRGRDKQVSQAFEATPGKKYTGFPMAVLINKYSASAAEIIAACLQDHRCAVIVGQRSFGKGTVQELLYLDADRGTRRGLMKVTASSYWRPSGKNINRGKDAKESDQWGVRPDKGFEVIVKDKDLKRLAEGRRRRELGGEAVPGDAPKAKPAKEPASGGESGAGAADAKKSAEGEAAKKAETLGKAGEEAGEQTDEKKLFDPQLDAAVEYVREQIGKAGR
jgi:carboxyl-terminal processing protease